MSKPIKKNINLVINFQQIILKYLRKIYGRNNDNIKKLQTKVTFYKCN